MLPIPIHRIVCRHAYLEYFHPLMTRKHIQNFKTSVPRFALTGLFLTKCGPVLVLSQRSLALTVMSPNHEV